MTWGSLLNNEDQIRTHFDKHNFLFIFFVARRHLVVSYLRCCESTFFRRDFSIHLRYCWWQPEIRRSPVEVGRLSHYLRTSFHPKWLFGISSVNSMFHLTRIDNMLRWFLCMETCSISPQVRPPYFPWFSSVTTSYGRKWWHFNVSLAENNLLP